MSLDLIVCADWSKSPANRAVWVAALNDLSAAVASEDDFDALMTVAALLRLTLAGRPLSHSTPDCVSEGGILGT